MPFELKYDSCLAGMRVGATVGATLGVARRERIKNIKNRRVKEANQAFCVDRMLGFDKHNV